MSIRETGPANIKELVSVIATKTFDVKGQLLTVIKIENTNTIPNGYERLSPACPDTTCMMAFEEEGPGSAERAIAEHRRYVSNDDLTASHEKRSGRILLMEGEPWFTVHEYNDALTRSNAAEKRRRAKERKP